MKEASRSLRVSVIGRSSAIWEKLEKLCFEKSLTNKLLLNRRLYRLRMGDDDTLVGHMNVFNRLIDELK
ncbi:unnamed protein product [Cuscuta campestris]|uniref:Uncharacterized protein n=1 Tax=Cuscuta campestris TaxID=132261 RepID=A0A484LBR8_9ASTE|nr:unnamed protein product [Cuscuta campestris]